MGMPIVRSGNFADVYEVRCPSGHGYAVKCFTREVKDLQQRYLAISDHLNQVALPFTVDFQYQEKGILIKGGWFPILKMRWVEGLTLNRFVDEHADKPHILEQLAQMWVKLAHKLRKANMAHADLQHGNVILVSGKTASSLRLRLIDYDGMFVPALAHTASGEVGHPNFQHPERIAQGIYNAEVDRFSHLVIYTALRCLMAGGRTLWQKYDNSETLLFREADLKSPGASAVFQELWQHRDAVTRTLAGHLMLACSGGLASVPLLDDIIVNGHPVELTSQQAQAVASLLNTGNGHAASPPPPPDVYTAAPAETAPVPAQALAYGVKPPEITPGREPLEWLTSAREATRGHAGRTATSGRPSLAQRQQPNRARTLQIVGFTTLGLVLLAVVVAVALRPSREPDEPVAHAPPPPIVVPKPPDVPPVSFPGGHPGLSAIAISPDGKTAATGGGGFIRTWNTSKRLKLRELKLTRDGTPYSGRGWHSTNRNVAFLAFGTDGSEVLAGAGMTLLLLSPDSTFLHHSLLPGGGQIVGGSYYGDPDAPKDRPKPFVYAHSSGSFIRWNWQDTAEGKGQVAAELIKTAFTTDGHKALCVDNGGGSPGVHLWDVKNGMQLEKPPLSGAHVALTSDGKLAMSSAVGLSRTLCFLPLDETLPAGTPPSAPRVPVPDEITGMALSANGNHAIATTADGKLHLWHVPTRQEVMRMDIDRPKTNSSPRWWHTVAFAPDGKHILLGSVTGALQWITLPKNAR
ncbi:MAG: hypothetical protein FJ271_01825 [Planctomycetes bacterium]|nr:hypothetical protein [Planctomycetota bacterium]